MKRIKIIGVVVLFVAAMLCISIGGCKSEEPEEPKFRINNESDSLAFAKIVELARSVDPDFLKIINLGDITTWSQFVRWEYDANTRQNRITGLVLVGTWTYRGDLRISDSLGELDCLESLGIYNPCWGGELTDAVCKLENLKELNINDTYLTALPDDIFKSSMVDVSLQRNALLTKIPTSISNLVNWKNSPEEFYFVGNGFTGKCPPLKCRINFAQCNFTSIDWNDIYGVPPYPPFFGATLIDNRLSEEIPQEILNDTVALFNIAVVTYPQQEGYGFPNMPSYQELVKRYYEYRDNHPDQDPFIGYPSAFPPKRSPVLVPGERFERLPESLDTQTGLSFPLGGAGLAVSGDDVFVGGELREGHGAPGM